MNSGYFKIQLINRKKVQFSIEKELLSSVSNFICDVQGRVHELGGGEIVVIHSYVCESDGGRVIHRQPYDHTQFAEAKRILQIV